MTDPTDTTVDRPSNTAFAADAFGIAAAIDGPTAAGVKFDGVGLGPDPAALVPGVPVGTRSMPMGAGTSLSANRRPIPAVLPAITFSPIAYGVLRGESVRPGAVEGTS